MKTILINATTAGPSRAAILQPAVEALHRGELVAFPTETVYGLGANAMDAAAVSKIFKAKGRPSDNPLIVHIANRSQLQQLVTSKCWEQLTSPSAVASASLQLMNKFWPGPLTLLFPCSSSVPTETTAGLPTVAVRMPANPVARALIEHSGLCLAAPSSNLSGRPSPTTAQHVLDDLDGRLPFIVDGGPATVGLESTVVDATRDPPLVLRPGGVTLEQLQTVVPSVQVYDPSVHGAELRNKPSTPGMKYRHYAPKAPVSLFQDRQSLISAAAAAAAAGDGQTGIIVTRDGGSVDYGSVNNCYVRDIYPDVGRHLYGALRDMDEAGVSQIFVETVPEHGDGLAIMNRLKKCAAAAAAEDL